MKASELRIGNQIIFEGVIRTVNPLILSIIANMECPDYTEKTKAKYFKPVPLTENHLINFGFVENETIDGVYYQNDDNGTIFGFGIMDDKNTFVYYGEYLVFTIPSFVHSFQNCIFALTGKELELKKPLNA